MEELIEAVRSEKCLYDTKHPDYMNIKLKESIWKQIAEALSMENGSEAKKSWEKLRNNHRDALRRQKILKPKSGSGAVNIKSWRFQENMAFLIPHMANRSTITNIEDNEPSPGSSNTIDIENDTQDNITDQELRDEELNQTLEPSTDPSADQGNKRKRHKRNTLNDLLSKSIEDHERRAANRQQERERLNANTTNDFTISNVKNDPLFHFFISMYETTKRLPPLSQHNIKTNIFSLVSQEEAKNLVQYSPRPHSTNSRNSDTRSYYSSYTPSPAEQPQEYLQTQTSPIIITQGSELSLLQIDSSGNVFAHSSNS